MTDDVRLADPLAAVRALPKGSLVVLRAGDAARRATLAVRLRALARERGLILLVADDPVLARVTGASGLHLPERRAHEAGHWRAKNPHWLISASAHSLRSALQAGHADMIFLSPVFVTASHRLAKPLSAPRARLIARGLKRPVFALGGVTARNASLLPGFSGIAAIGALIV
ncbi:MAG TPA: thiamine phosphate synthase [Rhizomicrobium sp.]|nr:thiamine phosphate synthase [Rhizomicrobium sp.]